jgi:hypothetical protein
MPTGVVWDGTKYIYGDQVWNGTAWVKTTPAGPSTGRVIAAVISLAVGAVALLQGWSWLSGALELQADGNQFAGLLVPLALAAGVVAAAFIIAGIVLLSKRR